MTTFLQAALFLDSTLSSQYTRPSLVYRPSGKVRVCGRAALTSFRAFCFQYRTCYCWARRPEYSLLNALIRIVGHIATYQPGTSSNFGASLHIKPLQTGNGTANLRRAFSHDRVKPLRLRFLKDIKKDSPFLVLAVILPLPPAKPTAPCPPEAGRQVSAYQKLGKRGNALFYVLTRFTPFRPVPITVSANEILEHSR